MRTASTPIRPEKADPDPPQPETDPHPKGAGTLEDEVQPARRPGALNADPENPDQNPSSGGGTKGFGTLEDEVGPARQG